MTAKHHQAFEEIKGTISEEVVLAYPVYRELFEIYTDASTSQLGAVISQNGRLIAFSVANYPVHRQNIQSLNKNCYPL